MADTNPITDEKRAFLESLGIQIPTGREVYDAIMGGIEPELLTENLETLDEPYADESEEDRKARYKGYSQSFAEYQKQFKEWARTFQQSVKTFRRALVDNAEKANRSEEESALSALEAQMQ